MRKNNGVTMVSLIVYVVVMTIVLGFMGSIITSFYNNTDAVQGNVQQIVEFNKFNTYFLKEVKLNNNQVDHVSEDNTYILFKSGNAFSISNNKIYYNNIRVCDDVQALEFVLEQDTEDANGEYSIINVTLEFESFNKSIRYKLENIY